MIRSIPLVLIAAALAACSTPREQPAPRIVTIEHPYTAGNGVIQNVMATPVATVASAGSSSPREPMQRLEIKMDNGKIQYVDTPSTEFKKGMRVTLTPDRYIKKA